MRPILQNRWKIQDNYIYFYGLRSNPYTFKNKIHLSAMDLETVTYMNGSYDLFTYKISKQIQKLIDEKIIVDKDDLIEYPKSIKEAHFCKKCGLNDFVLPGLELDNNELCPICSNENTMKNFLIPSPEITKINKSANSKYDAAIFYDGSIDSTLLLNYLTNVLNLRILALTIESSNTCDEFINLLDQIEKNFENVKFITKQTDDINNKYNLFYPILIEEKLPYLILSLDDINTDICKINKHNYKNKNIFLHKLINIKRKILRQNPLSKGQVNMLS
ncbi:MAG: hypothetical protein GX275_12950, partial [Clostridiales bacterium]|nr:hypothetical protein [Clostridiales bacterium]